MRVLTGAYDLHLQSQLIPVPMENVDILHEADDVTIICPTCGQWESQPVDESRHHFNVLQFKHFEDNDEPESSIHKCRSCNETFRVMWRYNDEPTIATNTQKQ